jgi:CheY-like chemotaxis protein
MQDYSSAATANDANDDVAHETATTRAPYTRKASGVQRIAVWRAADDDEGKPQPTFRRDEPDAKTVLVVEDEDAVRGLLVRSLATRYTVYEAKDGIEALQMLRQIDPPRALLCDVNMPRLDGYALARSVKSDPRLRSLSVIFVTARTGPMDVVEGINSGARVYLPKPFRMAELLDKVARAVK